MKISVECNAIANVTITKHANNMWRNRGGHGPVAG